MTEPLQKPTSWAGVGGQPDAAAAAGVAPKAGTPAPRTTPRVKFTLDARPDEMMTAYRTGQDFLRDHAASGQHETRGRSVVMRWKPREGDGEVVYFAAWGTPQHVRVRQADE